MRASNTTGKYCPPFFFDSFRIVARRWIYYGRAVRELGPAYYCGPGGRSCRREEKDWLRGCPGCRLTEAIGDWREGAEAELEETFGKTLPPEYSFDRLIEYLVPISNQLSMTNGRIEGSWDLTFARLAEIVIEERKRAEAVDRWNRHKSD